MFIMCCTQEDSHKPKVWIRSSLMATGLRLHLTK
uniref:Uncharacterized protein n=1 Tax=Arundo donax TaxID=35708 RepID=A0A0A9A9C3_ARUDO